MCTNASRAWQRHSANRLHKTKEKARHHSRRGTPRRSARDTTPLMHVWHRECTARAGPHPATVGGRAMIVDGAHSADPIKMPCGFCTSSRVYPRKPSTRHLISALPLLASPARQRAPCHHSAVRPFAESVQHGTQGLDTPRNLFSCLWRPNAGARCCGLAIWEDSPRRHHAFVNADSPSAQAAVCRRGKIAQVMHPTGRGEKKRPIGHESPEGTVAWRTEMWHFHEQTALQAPSACASAWARDGRWRCYRESGHQGVYQGIFGEAPDSSPRRAPRGMTVSVPPLTV